MNLFFKILAIGGVIAVAMLLINNNAKEDELTGWLARTAARAPGENRESIDRLESALSEASGSKAAQFISYDLAQACLASGEPSDLQRAIQVSENALSEELGEPLEGWFQRVLDSARSYQN